MAAKPTKQELAKQVEDLRPYEALAHIMLNEHVPPITITSGDYEVELYGYDRVHGGIVVQGVMAFWASKYAAGCLDNGADPHARSLGNKLRSMMELGAECYGDMREIQAICARTGAMAAVLYERHVDGWCGSASNNHGARIFEPFACATKHEAARALRLALDEWAAAQRPSPSASI